MTDLDKPTLHIDIYSVLQMLTDIAWKNIACETAKYIRNNTPCYISI